MSERLGSRERGGGGGEAWSRGTARRAHRLGRLIPEGSLAAELWDAASERPHLVDRVLVPLALFFAAWYAYGWLNGGEKANLAYFMPLADAFLHGRLGLLENPSWLNELVPSGTGLFYVVYPPVPAIILVPVVALFGPDVQQEWVSFLLGAVDVVLMYVALRNVGARRGVVIALTVVFAFASSFWYSAQAGSSWHFAHVVAIGFLLLAIIGCQRDWPAVLVGLAFAGAMLSRLPIALGVPFFLAWLVDRSIREEMGLRIPFGSIDGSLRADRLPPIRPLLAHAIPLAVAVAIPLGGYLLYDQLRFGSPFENGYALIPGLLQEDQYRDGFFSVGAVPRQLYSMFLTVPAEVSGFPWVRPRELGGLSLFLVSPIFLWVIRARARDWFAIGSWGAVALILIPILTHADPGGAQWGYRYAEDLYPFLFLLTARGLRGRFSFEAVLAIALGLLVNAWGMAALLNRGWA